MPERSPEDIQAGMDKQTAARAAAAEALKQRLQQGKQQANSPDNNQDNNPDKNTMRAQHYSANPPDMRKRSQAEKEWESAMSTFFAKQKKRVLKAVREITPGFNASPAPLNAVPQRSEDNLKIHADNMTVYNPESEKALDRLTATLDKLSGVTINVPQQAAPTVNVSVNPTPVTVENQVNIPKQDIPVVNINVPEQPAPIVNVETQKIKSTKQEVIRDPKTGEIVQTETTYKYEK